MYTLLQLLEPISHKSVKVISFFIGGSALGSLSLIYIFVKDTIQRRNIRAYQRGDRNIVIH